MTEPVAFMWKTVGGNVLGYATPLYTSEQLHQRVKMTQVEFDEWKFLYEDTVELSLTAYRVLNEILNSTHNISGKYVELSKRVYQCNDSMSVSKNQAELANLFIKYSPENPEETIEIVPDMKWFVISKEPDNNGECEFISGIETPDDWGYSERQEDVGKQKAYAYPFDTKEEAEKWTNPLTEAVQLPVEEK